MSAAKKASRRPVTGFTAAEQAALETLIIAAAVACVEASRAEATWQRDSPRGVCGHLAKECIATRDTVFSAGKALDAALAKLRGGK